MVPHPEIIIHINNDMNINIHIDINMNIRRPLPELERASLQLQPSNAILQTAAPPSCRLNPTMLQAAAYSLLCTILKGCH